MCVIAIVNKERPSGEMIRKMWERNPDGGGVAWREGGLAKWRKGLSLEEMEELCTTLPTPYIAHFRVASIGGVREELTHPFAVDEFEKSLEAEGETAGRVLFHNGHWSDWKKVLLETAVGWQKPIPSGKWSDTRAMAWLTTVYGPGFLDVLDEKAVLFGPAATHVVVGTGWKQIDSIWCSNDLFETPSYHTGWVSGRTMCRANTCTRTEGLDSSGYCPQHTKKPVEVKSQSPLDLAQRLADAELQHHQLKMGLITRDQLRYSKNELKRMRKEARYRPQEAGALVVLK